MPHDDSPTPPIPTRWAAATAPRGDEYDRRWDELAAAGQDPHGEAAFVLRFVPTTVLDAGCGTGRVARELARRGVRVVGVDIDADMLATAARKAPEIVWLRGDLASLDLEDRCGAADVPPFELIVLAGNVMIFLAPGTEADVLRRLAAHLEPGGHLIAGFQLQRDRLDLMTYDTYAGDAGLTVVERWSTWSCDPFDAASADYAVSVHRRVAP